MKPLIYALLGLAALICPQILRAQETYKLTAESVFYVDGSSNIHDWTSTSRTVEGQVVFGKNFGKKAVPAKGATVDRVYVKIPVNTIDGGRGPVMNQRTVEALKGDQHPHVVFELDQGLVTGIKDEAQGIFWLYVKGRLSIAGVTKPIDMTLDARRRADGKYQFTGSKAMKMTDFGVTPPTAMFGQIETGDDITVRFDVVAGL
ncbi:MAG: YceI family protein [Bacteroidia bacterium]|nr:YceI family protein [Bacteroidia bacterium]